METYLKEKKLEDTLTNNELQLIERRLNEGYSRSLQKREQIKQ